VGTLGKGEVHDLGRTEQDGIRLCHVTWNVVQFKIYELFIFGIFYLIVSLDCG
jgi:hypothetical protein